MSRMLIASILLAVSLAAWVGLRPATTATRAGKVLAFLALFLLPLLLTSLGGAVHLQHATSTRFCLSCHVMEPYGRSLQLDDTEHLPAGHFQNHRVPRDQACYACHTSYTMFGDFEAKLRGLRHVWVNYLGEIPEELSLYSPYHNRECLHCHSGARSFEEDELHAELRAELAANETSCLECHDLAHAIADLEGADLWSPAR